MKQYRFSSNTAHTEAEIRQQLEHWSKNEWLVSIEFSPVNSGENIYWESWPLSMVDAHFPDLIFEELEQCHRTHPSCYIMLCAHSQKEEKYKKVAQMLAYAGKE